MTSKVIHSEDSVPAFGQSHIPGPSSSMATHLLGTISATDNYTNIIGNSIQIFNTQNLLCCISDAFGPSVPQNIDSLITTIS